MKWSEEDLAILREGITPEMRAIAKQAQPVQPPEPQPQQATGPSPQHGVEEVQSFGDAASLLAKQALTSGVGAFRRTGMGLKQAGVYLAGDAADRKAVNEESARLDEELSPYDQSPAGRIGNAIGTAAHFLLPGMHGATIGKAALAGALYEGAQPSDTGGTETTPLLMQRGMRALGGAALGAGAKVIGDKLFKSGQPIPPNRQPLVDELERRGFQTTPAIRTGAIDHWLTEKRLATQPETLPFMQQVAEHNRAIPQQEALAAIQQPSSRGMTAGIQAAKDAARAKYEQFGKMIGDFPKSQSASRKKFADTLDDIALMNADVKRDVANLKTFIPGMNGKTFSSLLQKYRAKAYSASQIGGKQHDADSFKEIEHALEGFGEDAAKYLHATGKAPADLLNVLREARTLRAATHAVEHGTNLRTGEFNPNTFLGAERGRKIEIDASSMSALDAVMKDPRRAAELWQQTLAPDPLPRNSGTPLGMALTAQSRLKRILGATNVGKELQKMKGEKEFSDYLRADQPNAIGRLLGPRVTNAIRRMLPPMAIGTAEGVTD